MKEYIASLEKEFSLIENGFKEEEKRALTDYKSNDNEYTRKLAFLAYKSDTCQVRIVARQRSSPPGCTENCLGRPAA